MRRLALGNAPLQARSAKVRVVRQRQRNDIANRQRSMILRGPLERTD
ncbi:hypothetical protein [Sphingomonas sp. NIC1]|nr:hypothetical protein [Sphingomonas sp. NIC1]